MNNKLELLTEKIYREGVIKAEEEAEHIIRLAKEKAKNIISEAKEREKAIIDQAHQTARELKQNVHSELKLSSRQFINTIKQKVSRLIESEVLSVPITTVFEDKSFIKEIIELVINKWHLEDPDSASLSLLLPEADKNILEEHFIREVRERFNTGIDISFDPKMKTGFKISPENGNYRISFMDEDFIELFKTFLRPRLISFLFGTEKSGV